MATTKELSLKYQLKPCHLSTRHPHSALDTSYMGRWLRTHASLRTGGLDVWPATSKNLSSFTRVAVSRQGKGKWRWPLWRFRSLTWYTNRLQPNLSSSSWQRPDGGWRYSLTVFHPCSFTRVAQPKTSSWSQVFSILEQDEVTTFWFRTRWLWSGPGTRSTWLSPSADASSHMWHLKAMVVIEVVVILMAQKLA